jgi:hypothetical protein
MPWDTPKPTALAKSSLLSSSATSVFTSASVPTQPLNSESSFPWESKPLNKFKPMPAIAKVKYDHDDDGIESFSA